MAAQVSRDQVIQLYRTILGRDPYPTELAKGGWVDRHANSGMNLDKLTQVFQNSDEAKQAATQTSAIPSGTGQPAEAVDPYAKMVTDWYNLKPATPGTFKYSPEQAATDKTSVQQEYRPFYQEQATHSGEDFTRSLQAAREGFSRRGLWGAEGGTGQTVDPSTGLAYTTATAPVNAGGPVSGLRMVGEANLGQANDRSNTAFGRAYTQAVAQGAQNRQAEAQDVYQKTIRDPYEEQYKNWQSMIGGLQGAR